MADVAPRCKSTLVSCGAWPAGLHRIRGERSELGHQAAVWPEWVPRIEITRGLGVEGILAELAIQGDCDGSGANEDRSLGR